MDVQAIAVLLLIALAAEVFLLITLLRLLRRLKSAHRELLAFRHEYFPKMLDRKGRLKIINKTLKALTADALWRFPLGGWKGRLAWRILSSALKSGALPSGRSPLLKRFGKSHTLEGI